MELRTRLRAISDRKTTIASKYGMSEYLINTIWCTKNIVLQKALCNY